VPDRVVFGHAVLSCRTVPCLLLIFFRVVSCRAQK
jgi:hypothetical protein